MELKEAAAKEMRGDKGETEREGGERQMGKKRSF